MRARIPSKFIIFITAVISSAISLLAGYLLYAKSISVLRDSVADTSAAESESTVRRLGLMLEETKLMAETGYLWFRREDVMNLSKGMRHVSEMYTVQAFAMLKATEGYSISYYLVKVHNDSCAECTPPWEDVEGFSRQAVWYDPVTDAEDRPEKYWMSLTLFGNSQEDDEPTYDLVTHEWTRSLRALDNSTGDYAGLISKHTEDVKFLYDYRTAVPEEGSWSPTFVWDSIDGAPYSYISYEVRRPLVHGGELYHLVLTGFFLFRPWVEVISEFEVENTNLVVLDTTSFQVYAHTLYTAPSIKPECYDTCFSCLTGYAGEECLLEVSDLGPTVSGAVNASLPRARGSFFVSDLEGTRLHFRVQYEKYYAADDVEEAWPLYRKDFEVDTSLDGGEHFTRLTGIYTAGEKEFSLLWLRSVDSVNAEVYAALVQLIAACAVIFIVDVLIAVAEVLFLSQPLEKLAAGNKHLETMELDEAEASIVGIYKPMMAREVAHVTDGLVTAIRCLRQYKSFLPNTLFAVELSDFGEEEEGDGEMDEVEGNEGGGVSLKASLLNSPAETSYQLCRGTVARVQFVRGSYPTFPTNFGTLVEALHGVAGSLHGVVHGFSVTDPLCFFVTWNVGTRCSGGGVISALNMCMRLADVMEAVCVATPAVGVVTGLVHAGNMGSAGNKGFGMTGAVLGQLEGVAAVAVAACEGAACDGPTYEPVALVHPTVAHAAEGACMFRALGLLHMAGLGEPLLLRQVLRGKQEEWMYEQEDEQEDVVEDPLLGAMLEVLQDPEARPDVELGVNASGLQRWAAENLRCGEAVGTYGYLPGAYAVELRSPIYEAVTLGRRASSFELEMSKGNMGEELLTDTSVAV